MQVRDMTLSSWRKKPEWRSGACGVCRKATKSRRGNGEKRNAIISEWLGLLGA